MRDVRGTAAISQRPALAAGYWGSVFTRLIRGQIQHLKAFHQSSWPILRTARSWDPSDCRTPSLSPRGARVTAGSRYSGAIICLRQKTEAAHLRLGGVYQCLANLLVRTCGPEVNGHEKRFYGPCRLDLTVFRVWTASPVLRCDMSDPSSLPWTCAL
ncbi:hypothetical protein SKAU_G00045780 [Synaphobranchus kaupii]|uniref:Uncharacterized protein n=1 Tax=Synaphobranchus kaupii TaxID=118154 RepID=A0A9Q1J8Y1_SYNKA|nr:hypothetical protein SKAU_G00045780 [Synaphobranchus kaupii]